MSGGAAGARVRCARRRCPHSTHDATAPRAWCACTKGTLPPHRVYDGLPKGQGVGHSRPGLVRSRSCSVAPYPWCGRTVGTMPIHRGHGVHAPSARCQHTKALVRPYQGHGARASCVPCSHTMGTMRWHRGYVVSPSWVRWQAIVGTLAVYLGLGTREKGSAASPPYPRWLRCC